MINAIRSGETMKLSAVLFLKCVLLLSVFSGCSSGDSLSCPPEDPVDDTQAVFELARGNNEFALDLYNQISLDNGSDNIFISPYSISSALGMTYAGADGQTADEMADVLHFTLPVDVLNRAFSSLTESLSSGNLAGAESGDPFTLSIVNGLWVQDGFNLLADYVAEVEEYYSAAVRNLDFSGDPEGSRETINNWVAEQTMDRILDLIPPGVLSADTRVVLTNAVYFKASWLKPFNEHATADARFILRDESPVIVPMMNQTDYFNYVSTDGCSALEFEYAAGNATMLVLLPDGDIEEYQAGFDIDQLETVRRRLTSSRVTVSLPRFEFTRSVQLGQILRGLGMESAFSNNADFSGFTGTRELFISEVLHKAFVKVDEEGTEAAAATAVMMNLTAMPEEPVVMNINRPFMFFIIDRESGCILFMGRVMDPSA